MESITLQIGSIIGGSSGQVNDNRRTVKFEGEQLASVTQYGYNERTAGITDTRGVTETLYKTSDDRLIVHVDDWSRWQGEPNTEQIHEIEEADLRAGGRFEQLGFESGYQDALTLDQALDRLYSPGEDVVTRELCERCGDVLELNASPYHVDNAQAVFLCETCAAGGD